MTDVEEQRILICAPLGQDAGLACQVLERAGLFCHVCKTFAELLKELERGAGAILTVEEALSAEASEPLVQFLTAQPTWSDLPILVLTKGGINSPLMRGAYELFGNLTLLERPVRAPTLVSALRSAVRARLRQYEIRASDQRKDEFLAMLAHELRNPLAPISAAAQLLELVASDEEKVKQTNEIIARQVSHMTNLIDDLLDVARVTRGLITLDKEPLDIRHILSEAVEQVNPQINARHQHLTLHLPPDLAPVLGDRKRLVQVVANLLNNASKYTPENGNIVVRLQVKGSDIVLSITDDGIGIEPEMVVRIFDLFTQAERTSDRSLGGLGLGLALVKSLVVSHGGKVQATSGGAGKGSTFTVSLPSLANIPTLALEVNMDEEPGTNVFHSRRLMLVDDNKDAADALAMLLDATGHSVTVEYAAYTAIECARKTSPQICILDIGLPDMDGNELATRLRAMPETAEAVLIAVTGYSQERDRQKSIAAGFDYHFVKPVDVTKLLALLAEAA
jgi:signal transduction histidine kinase/BarA-like signal transduction histidine kinase